MTQFSRVGVCGIALMLCLGVALSAVETLPTPVAKPLSGGWNLRTGVFPKQEATASFDKAGVLTISGGGYG